MRDEKENAPKFTPGPWRILPTRFHSGIIADASEKLVANTQYREVAGESAANARLIAAAPDLYEACERLAAEVEALGAFENDIRPVTGNSNYRALTTARRSAVDALAKVRGGAA